MRTSLIETEKIEQWLLKVGDPADRLVTEVNLQLHSDLQDKLRWQVETYELAHRYGREKLREEIKRIERRLFASPKHKSFQNQIRSIFKR